MEERDTILDTYNRRAAELSAQYDSTSTDRVFPHLSGNLPRGHNLKALDIGCGSGRDAHWLAEQGFTVLAVDGATGMLEQARRTHAHPNITYAADLLPELTNTRATGEKFDFILMNGIWMHIHPARRAEALGNIAHLSRPGGCILLNLRHGPVPPDRPMFGVSLTELSGLAATVGLQVGSVHGSKQDALGRSDVHWQDVYLRPPPAPSARTHTRRTTSPKSP